MSEKTWVKLTDVLRKTSAIRYGVMGATFGAVFPIVALALWGRPLALFGVICSAPFFLGLFAYFIGFQKSRAKSLQIQELEIERALEELRVVKDRLSAILEHSPSATYECLANENWTMNFMSPHIAEITGYPATDFIGDSVRSYVSVIHPEDRALVQEAVFRAIERKSMFDIQYRIRHRDGSERWVWERGSISAITGNLVGVIFDVTAQRLNQFELSRRTEELKHANERLEEAQRVAKIGSWSFELDTQTISWSKQMYSLFPERIEDGPPSVEKHEATLHPDDREMLKSAVAECIQWDKPYKLRFRSLFPDRELWLEARGHAVRDSTGKVIRIQGTCQDINDVVLAEERLQLERGKAMHNAKLASIGEVAAGVAHEINNPLAVIMGNLPLLDRLRGDDTKFRNKLQAVEKAGERISRIVRGLKKFSRTTEGIVYKPERVSEILAEVLVLTEGRSKRHATPISVEQHTDAEILCDGVEIEQVLVNLINNGIDAASQLPEKWIRIEVLEEGREVIIRVIDSGCGISPEIEKKLFQPFFTTKPIGEGTGLGLSISKGIIDQHGATLQLNREFRNTCFEIRFQRHAGELNAVA